MWRWAVCARANFSADANRYHCARADVHPDLHAYPDANADLCAYTCAIYSPRGCVNRRTDRALRDCSDVYTDRRARPDANSGLCACAHTCCGVHAYRNTRGTSHASSRLDTDLDVWPGINLPN